MTGTTITIVIVCRNAREALEHSLQHVVALGDPRVRLVVIDGASSDGTVGLLNHWADRLSFWASEPDSGIYDAMNKGWLVAEEDSYVIFLGAGDKVISLPAPEETVNDDGAMAPVLIGDCLVGASLFVSRWDRGMRFHNTAHHQALLIHKSLHTRPPFDSRLRIFADWDFNLRLFHAGVRAKRVDGFRAYAEPGGVSSTPDLREVVAVATRHGGRWAGFVAWLRYRAFLLWRALQNRVPLRRQPTT